MTVAPRTSNVPDSLGRYVGLIRRRRRSVVTVRPCNGARQISTTRLLAPGQQWRIELLCAVALARAGRPDEARADDWGVGHLPEVMEPRVRRANRLIRSRRACPRPSAIVTSRVAPPERSPSSSAHRRSPLRSPDAVRARRPASIVRDRFPVRARDGRPRERVRRGGIAPSPVHDLTRRRAADPGCGSCGAAPGRSPESRRVIPCPVAPPAGRALRARAARHHWPGTSRRGRPRDPAG